MSLVLARGDDNDALSSDLTSPSLIACFADELARRGMAMYLHKLAMPWRDGLARLTSSDRHDGMIVIGADEGQSVFESIAAVFRPLVVLGGPPGNDTFCTVCGDELGGAARAVQHLRQLGRRRIGFFSAIDGPTAARQYLAYQAALASAGLAVAGRVSGSLLAGVPASSRSFVGPQAAFDAVLADGNVAALRLTQILVMSGVRIPEDVAIICLGDAALAGQSVPSLTSVGYDMGAGAAAAVGLLIQRMAGEDSRSIVLPSQLFAGESTLGQGAHAPAGLKRVRVTSSARAVGKRAGDTANSRLA